ncbi:hypothetical protein EST38_g5012 [Candolleomyces aberdarensis]|uniref:Uncharacterized protein n=1 Tax=Candolleomyces aberdarensis TaxID=2316362 RepID=A0A4Q2DND1_9AGAR|nr:hypothetical protein EST38_g5012 [Candolleomyces aberdarensis]
MIKYLEEMDQGSGGDTSIVKLPGTMAGQIQHGLDPSYLKAIDEEARSIWNKEIREEFEFDEVYPSDEDDNQASKSTHLAGTSAEGRDSLMASIREIIEQDQQALADELVMGAESPSTQGRSTTLSDSETSSIETNSIIDNALSTDEVESDSDGDSEESRSIDTRPISEIIKEAGVELQEMADDQRLEAIQGCSLLEMYQLHVQGAISESEAATALLCRLDRKLRQWGLKGKSLLRLLRGTQSLISGSFVLLILNEESTFEPGDIDIYTIEDYYLLVIDYFKAKGYVKVHKVSPGYRASMEAISKIFELRDRAGRKINIIVSTGMAVLPILHFHSTIVMNYISHHGLVCLYETTMHHIGLINFNKPIPKSIMKCVEKYIDRGYQMWMRLEDTHECGEDPCCPQTIRSLLDNHVMHIRFDGYQDKEVRELRRMDANHAVWRLATGFACFKKTWDQTGFVACNTEYTVFYR